jgi:polo-like kinase 1
VITEAEVRYFIRQIVLAVDYLHNEMHVIHRDLKLANIFMTDDVHLKVGDFGLATIINRHGERKE